jgi:hypothetical protein
MDLTRFGDVERSQPAYATDIMAATQGAVRSVISWSDKRYFTVSASGSWGQDTPLVATATLDSGLFAYDLPEHKVAVQERVRFGMPFHGTVTSWLSDDLGTTFTQVGSTTDTDADTTGAAYPISQTLSEAFEARFTFARGSTNTQGPILSRWVVRAEPAVGLVYLIQWPILLAEQIDTGDGAESYLDPAVELDRIKEWHATREVLTAQEGTESYSVIVSDFEWRPSHKTRDNTGWNGTCTVKFKVI